MTGRERLLAAARGGEVDRRASLNEDAVILDQYAPHPDKAVLVRVLCPFGRGDLLATLKQNPGAPELDLLVRAAIDDAETALAAGADGIFYVIQGPEPTLSSPMQYGGHYLDRDREVLTEVLDAPLNVVYVDAGPGAYIDFLSDLPAAIFSWDVERTGVTPSEVREMRTGALAAQHPDADIDFSPAVIAYVRQ